MDGEHNQSRQDTDVTPDLSVAIPFYNEAPNVVPVLTDLLDTLNQARLRFELVAVDNGSSDETGRFIELMCGDHAGIVPVRVPQNKGYGFGILSGLKRARGAVLGYTWGDGQVPASDLLKIYRALTREKAHMAKAVRVKRFDGLFRLVQTRCYSVCFSMLFGGEVRDPNGCPKLFKRVIFEKMELTSFDWLLDPEIMIKATQMQCKIAQVPVHFLKRERGISKVSPFTAFRFLFRLLKMRFGPGRINMARTEPCPAPPHRISDPHGK